MNTLQSLTEMTEALVDTRSKVAELEAQLEAEKSKLKLYEEELLPEAMRETGQDLLKLPTGQYLELVDMNIARIPKNNKEQAYRYLESIGEGGMIKRMVVCEFRKDQEEEAKKALAALNEAGFSHAYFDKSHQWNTFQKWVDDQFEQGKNLPKDILGIFTRTVARIKKS